VRIPLNEKLEETCLDQSNILSWKKAPKSKDKHRKKAIFRGHRNKFGEKEALLCAIDFDPVVVVKPKLSLEELSKSHESALNIVGLDYDWSVLEVEWEKEFEPNFKYHPMTEGKLDAKRALKWAEAVCKCSCLGFSFKEKMLEVAKFMKESENFEDFIDQWKDFAVAKHALSRGLWYSCNLGSEWKQEHVKPAVIKSWAERAKTSEKAQIEYFDKFMTAEEKSTMGGAKPFQIAQSFRNSYFTDHHCSPCKNCGVENWHSMHVVFDQIRNPNIYDAEQCGRICRECMAEALKSRNFCFEDKGSEVEDKKAHDLNAKPDPFFQCPRKGCDRGCVIHGLKSCQYEYFAEKLCVEVKKLQKVFDQSAEAEVRRNLAEAELHYDCSFEPNSENPEDYSHKLNRTKINQIDATISKISNNITRRDLRKSISRLNSHYYRYELSYWLYVLQKRVKEAVTARNGEDWDKMYTEVDSAQQAVNSTNNYIRFARSDRKFCGMTEQQLMRSVLGGCKTEIKFCVNVADRCGVCMTTVGARESEMLSLHTKGEWRSPSRPVPCKACPECWDGYVGHTSALGKPQLKCCALSCGRALNADHAKKIAPKAYAKYESAIMKFEMKKVKNYKTCPNGHGFLTYENCEASRMKCPICSINFCPGCGAQPHEDIGDGSCLDFLKHQHSLRWAGKSEESGDKAEDKKAEEFFAEVGESSKQCPYCNVWIEKNGGCQHMTCHSCRGEFCWLCNGKWRGHSSCDTPIKISRPYFHNVFPKKVFEDEEPEFWESDSEVNSECSEGYANFLGCFGKNWINPGSIYHSDPVVFTSKIPYENFLNGFGSDSDSDSEESDVPVVKPSEVLVNENVETFEKPRLEANGIALKLALLILLLAVGTGFYLTPSL